MMATFPAIRIEGGLLGPDVLDQLLSAALPGQKPADFGLDGRRNLTDEIAAIFADARALWQVFQHRLQRLSTADPATSVTRDAWAIPFLGLLGYEPRYNARAYEVDGLSFAISHRAGEAEDTPPLHIVGARQELGRIAASGRPRLAPHSLVQEYLNRTEHVWGLVTNGPILRLLRDSTFVRRQAYVEFDLTAMFEESRFQDFAALYRLLHRTRLPRDIAAASDCLLEQYYAHAVEQGGRIREHLRDGVEECLTRLANGFLQHPANDELRRRVAPDCTGNERLSAEDLYRQLLRLVYRCLFLLVSEDRGLLSPDPIYREHYSIARLRRLLENRAAFTEHDDLWQSLRVLWQVLSHEKLAVFLQLAPLNGELFSSQRLDAFTITNRDLLSAFWFLAWYQDSATSPPRRVNYAALDVEELGSVYESLLEFHPVVDHDAAGRPEFKLLVGSERKTTGSYYTPPELVNELIESALEPVMRDRLRQARELASREVGSREGDDGDSVVSRSGGLEERDADGKARLHDHRALAQGGTLWADSADATSSGVDSGKRRRGMGATDDATVCSIPSDRTGERDRIGDRVAPERRNRPPDSTAGGADPHTAWRDSQDAALPHWYVEAQAIVKLKSPTSRPPYSLLAEQALLSLRVCDPACGSGHFLLAAARRLGKELARWRTGEDEPAPERVREATREVISHCIYGVDKNPLAVDLCRVALWLESHTGDKPLTFLDHRIRCGDSLIGVFDLEGLKDGIPDKAFEPLEGDDRATARERARRNREERTGQMGLFAWSPANALADFARKSRTLDAITDDTPEAIRRKQQLFAQSQADPAWRRQKDACDLWSAAFFQPLQPETPTITSGALADRLGGRPIDPRLVAQAWALSAHQRFFHWPLEFPEVFADGGFDVILSNPPWERLKLQEQEFFAVRDARIANAPTKAARAMLIKALPETNPQLYGEFVEALRAAAGASGIMRHGGRFPLTGRGDINTYAVFAELCRTAIRPGGRCGIIVPSGIATDDTTKFFFQNLVQSQALVSLYDFENRKGIFPAIDSRIKFCLLTLTHTAENVTGQAAAFVFFALDVDDLRRAEKRFSLTADDIALLNPNTGNCPIFRTQADAELTKAIYRRVPILWREAPDGQPDANPWRLSFKTLFHMANDSHHFRTAQQLEANGYRREGNVFVSPYDRYLPLYEAKMLHQFDHRWATYEEQENRRTGDWETEARDVTPYEKRHPAFVVQPRYWVREEVVESAIPKYPEPLAIALHVEHRPSMQYVMALWAAGFYLQRGDKKQAAKLLHTTISSDLDRAVTRALGAGTDEVRAQRLAQDFPLTDADVEAVAKCFEAPESLARDLVSRFSPRWFLGWRDICRSTDERTLIASVVPRVAVGHKFLLLLSKISPSIRLLLLANMDSFILDYCARQKIGGTSMSYFVLRQIPVLSPDCFGKSSPFASHPTPLAVQGWLLPRILELVYTVHDLAPLARDCGDDGSPFSWNDERRFEIRCELDAAFFHLYLPCEPDGSWRQAEGETPQQLAALKGHFPQPRHAVAYILDQFPIVRQKDEQAHGSYRTRERILAIYDAMLAAQRSGHPYQTTLNPPPGSR
jgi:hypothetical protein